MRELRDSLLEVWMVGALADAVPILNGLLEDSARPRISSHNGRDPHFHFDPGDGPLVEWLSAATAMALGAVIVNHGYERFGICESGSCGDVYVDTSEESISSPLLDHLHHARERGGPQTAGP